MKKEFVESSETIFYKQSDWHYLVKCLMDYVKEDRKLYSCDPFTAKIDGRVKDAVLCDAFNAMSFFSYECLSGEELHNDARYSFYASQSKQIDERAFLTNLVKSFSDYIFNKRMINSIKIDCDNDGCLQPIAFSDGAAVLLDFINYVFEKEGYNRQFTMHDLETIAFKEKYDMDMLKLNFFLRKIDKHSEQLQNGISVEEIYREVANNHNLGEVYIMDNRCYYKYDENKLPQTHRSGLMNASDAIGLELDLEALACAYEHLADKDKKEVEIPIIREKIKCMKIK